MTSAEFGSMLNRWRPRFEAIANRYTRSKTVAEDIVSESFMVFWERRDQIPADTNVEAYIFTIVRNKCLSWLRSQSAHTKIEAKIRTLHQRVLAADIRSLQALDPGELFSKEVESITRKSLDELPELTRNVFTDRRFGELSYREISQKYGITLRRVEFELAKAVKQLRIALKDYIVLIFILLSAS